MLWTIARKEIASNLVSYKFFIIILLTALLIFTSFFIMYPRLQSPPRRLPAHQAHLRTADRGHPSQPSFDLRQGPGRSHDQVLRGQPDRHPGPGRTAIRERRLFLLSLPGLSLYRQGRAVPGGPASSGFDQISREKRGRNAAVDAGRTPFRGPRFCWENGWGTISAWPVPFLLVTALGMALLNLDSSIRFFSGQRGTNRTDASLFAHLYRPFSEPGDLCFHRSPGARRNRS